MFEGKVIPPQFLEFMRYSAITGFIVTTTLIVNINHHVFGTIFRERAKSYWWLFVLSGIIPLLVFIYIFNFIFGGRLWGN